MRTVEQVIRSGGSVAPPVASEDDSALHLIIVEWLDITAYAGWETHEEATLTPFKTVGWLVFSDDKVVKVANTIDAEGIGGGITVFPRGCIEKMEAV